MFEVNRSKFGQLMKAHNGCCVYCGTVVRPDSFHRAAMPSRDHDIPKCRLSMHVPPNNVVLSCGICNEVKDNMTGEEYRHFLKNGKLHPIYIGYLERTARERLVGRVKFDAGVAE